MKGDLQKDIRNLREEALVCLHIITYLLPFIYLCLLFNTNLSPRVKAVLLHYLLSADYKIIQKDSRDHVELDLPEEEKTGKDLESNKRARDFYIKPQQDHCTVHKGGFLLPYQGPFIQY